jgi:hypothetical protein
MPLSLGSDKQATSLVVDTGSGSLYSQTYNPATSTTSKDRKITGYIG